MVGLKNKVVGLDSGKYMGIFSMYNFKFDPALGIGKVICRWVPCAYLTGLEIPTTPWGVDLNDKD